MAMLLGSYAILIPGQMTGVFGHMRQSYACWHEYGTGVFAGMLAEAVRRFLSSQWLRGLVSNLFEFLLGVQMLGINVLLTEATVTTSGDTCHSLNAARVSCSPTEVVSG